MPGKVCARGGMHDRAAFENNRLIGHAEDLLRMLFHDDWDGTLSRFARP